MKQTFVVVLVVGLAAWLALGCGAPAKPSVGAANVSAVLGVAVDASGRVTPAQDSKGNGAKTQDSNDNVPTTQESEGPLTGAIFTTTADGQTVNGNNYGSCCEVYLNGGPQPNAPCDAAGLPDGEYYFQVTDPPGKTLLSSDDLSRRIFRVAGGLIVEYLGGTSGECDHAIGTGKCPDSISIQLMPFDPTPNNGNEYKVWVTPVGALDEDAPGNSFGFVPSSSKTDNFKCRQCPPPCDISCRLCPPTTIGEVTGVITGGTGPFTCTATTTVSEWTILDCTVTDSNILVTYEPDGSCQAPLTVTVTDDEGCQTECTICVNLCDDSTECPDPAPPCD